MTARAVKYAAEPKTYILLDVSLDVDNGTVLHVPLVLDANHSIYQA